MKVVILTVRKNGRQRGQEACLLKNEGKTLTGKYPTRLQELQAVYADDPSVTIERVVSGTWPEWAQ